VYLSHVVIAVEYDQHLQGEYYAQVGPVLYLVRYWLSGCCQGVVRVLSGLCEGVVRRLCGNLLSGGLLWSCHGLFVMRIVLGCQGVCDCQRIVKVVRGLSGDWPGGVVNHDVYTPGSLFRSCSIATATCECCQGVVRVCCQGVVNVCYQGVMSGYCQGVLSSRVVSPLSGFSRRAF